MNYYEPLTYVVPPEEDGYLLKTILHHRLQLSRKLLSRLKLTDQGITVNGERRYTTARVRAGDVVQVRMQEEESDDILPQDLPLDILYEDEHILIVNKEAGIIVHPTIGHYINTVANAVVHHWKRQGQKFRFRPVHRLDRETSGVLAVAKNPYAHQNISEQMKSGQVKKEYIAFVHGIVQPAEGTIDAPIDRDPEQPHIRIVTASGYPSVTHYAVEETYRRASRVRLSLETGRTHQIRVHMKHIGHPLIGDSMYGLAALPGLPGEAEPEASRLDGLIGRQALHASRLGFRHPAGKRWVEFEAPFPEDLRRLAQALTELS